MFIQNVHNFRDEGLIDLKSLLLNTLPYLMKHKERGI